MKEVTLIYPHQLFANHPAIKTGREIYLIEEPLLLTEFPTHTQKLLLHRLSMQAYKKQLIAKGFTVSYLSVTELPSTQRVFTKLVEAGVEHLHVVDTTDYWLEKRLQAAATTHSLTLTHYESPLFILPKAEAIERYAQSKKQMARFYKTLRVDKRILLEADHSPIGGQWNFDEDNRKKIPKGTPTPAEPTYLENSETKEALTWLKNISGEHYGEAVVWLPYTHDGAKTWLIDFLDDRLAKFGTYEDAIQTKQTRLFHSTLSPLINIGLITPTEVVEAVIAHGQTHSIGLNNIEGFVRQVIGWREFIRASYECDGSDMRTKNFWKHTGTLPDSWWDGSTGILPVDDCIKKALAHGYNHHIERLMVMGNFMLLNQTHPNEVYRWFMAMYVDAYDWVMVPNVYGMSQFADGGSFATKPYISGSNYLKKMSDYPKGDWEELWTALYWNFISTHQTYFQSNHRLAMMPRLLANMDQTKKEQYHSLAANFLRDRHSHTD